VLEISILPQNFTEHRSFRLRILHLWTKNYPIRKYSDSPKFRGIIPTFSSPPSVTTPLNMNDYLLLSNLHVEFDGADWQRFISSATQSEIMLQPIHLVGQHQTTLQLPHMHSHRKATERHLTYAIAQRYLQFP